MLAVLSSLPALLLFWLLVTPFPGRPWLATCCSLAWTLSRDSLYLSPLLMGESFAALLLFVSLLFVLVGIRQGSRLALGLGGLGLGYAALTRGYLLPVIVLLPAALYLTSRLSRNRCLWLVAAASLLPALWLGRNHRAMGRWEFSTQPQQELWCGNNRWARGSWPGDIASPGSEQIRYLTAKYPGFSGLKENERADILLKEAASDFRSNPARPLRLLPRKIAILFSPASYMGFDAAYLVSLPLALAGFVLMLANRNQRVLGILASAPVAAVAITSVLTFGDPRFRATVDPLLFLAAGYAAGCLGAILSLHRHAKKVGGAA
jgi:hypothetical protein